MIKAVDGTEKASMGKVAFLGEFSCWTFCTESPKFLDGWVS
jgi:hypothetical protein